MVGRIMNLQGFVTSAKSNDIWSLGNQVLYDLCEKYPKHTCPEQIVAKIWLIGRSYAAAIERRKNKTTENDIFYEKTVVRAIIQAKLDLKLEKLMKFTQITDDSIIPILDIHKYLMAVFEKITSLKKRSLVSKYLHFHFPDLFYIYDSRAMTALRKLQKGKRFKLPQCELDKEYATFFLRLHSLQKDIVKETKVFLTPREMDRILLR